MKRLSSSRLSRKLASAATVLAFLSTTLAYPQDVSSLRALSFAEKAKRPNNTTRVAHNRPSTPALTGDSFPVMLPAGVKEMTEMLKPDHGPNAEARAEALLAKDIKPAKRGIGRKVAAAKISLRKKGRRFSASLGRPEPFNRKQVLKAAQKTSDVVRRGLDALLGRQGMTVVRQSLAAVSERQKTIAVEYRQDHDRLMNLSPLTRLRLNEKRGIYFDIDIPANLDKPENRQGLNLLYAMGLLHQFCRIAGVRQEEALLKVLEFYKGLKKKDKEAVCSLLSHEGIDNGKNFLAFLVEGAKPNASMPEVKRYAALLMKNELADLAYADTKIAQEVLDTHGRPDMDKLGGLTALRETVHKGLAETYAYDMERVNARRVAAEAQEQGMDLVMGFLGRAGLVEQLLMASSEVVPTEKLKAPIGNIARRLMKNELKLKTPELQGLAKRWKDARAAFGEVQKMLNAVSKPSVPLPQLMGAIDDFNLALNMFLMDARKRVQEVAREKRGQIAAEMKKSGNKKESPTLKQLQKDLENISNTVDGFTTSVFKEFEILAADIPSFKKVVNVAIQRLNERESLHLFLLNRLLDPYLGETSPFRRLLNEGGPTLHTTADMTAWLSKVTHWIQALPAYAFYKIVDLEGGNYRIMAGCERDTLEYAFKGNIDAITDNIEEVMRLEHAALARSILAERVGITEREIKRVQEVQRQRGEDEDASREEAIRLILKDRGLDDAVAALATLVDATYCNLEDEVTKYMAEHEYRDAKGGKGRELERIVALRHVIRENQSVGNLVKTFLMPLDRKAAGQAEPDEDGKQTKQRAKTLITRLGLDKTYATMRPLAMERRKDPLAIHNLTTLGPGETTTYLQTWLETGITLRLFCRENNLDAAVERRLKEYRARMSHAAWHVIQELDLEGELFDYMVNKGMDPGDKGQRLRASLEIIGQYREVSNEVARICAIMEWEEEEGKKQKTDLLDPNAEIEEPETVTRYIASHKADLEKEATMWAIGRLGLYDAVKRFADKDGRTSIEEIARNLLASDDELGARSKRRQARPVIDEQKRQELRRERDAHIRHLARKAVVKASGLEDGAGVYNRLHSGSMALYTAREEVVGEYIRNNLDGRFDVLNEVKYRYEASGPYKKFHLGYTPSRVDLGEGERHSVEGISKVVSAVGQSALNKVSSIYELFSLPGPAKFRHPALAEFFKARENFFTRGGVFYLSLGEGVNIDALMMGDAEEYMYFSNLRGDRIVLPSGESYRGFCVPKEFFLIYAVMMASHDKEAAINILRNFAPARGRARKRFLKEIEDSFEDVAGGGYRIIEGSFLGRMSEALNIKAKDMGEWEKKARAFFEGHYEKYFDLFASNAFLSRLPKLTRALNRWGITMSDEERRTKRAVIKLAQWTNKKLQGLEMLNRMGPFRKLERAGRLLVEARKRSEEAGRPVKPLNKVRYFTVGSYKAGTRVDGESRPITDARLSAAAVKLLLFAGIYPLDEFDAEGKEIIRQMAEDFPHPAQFRIAGTVGGADILTAIPDIKPEQMDGIIDEVKGWLAEFGINEKDITGCCGNLAMGADLAEWPKIKNPPLRIARNRGLSKRIEAIRQGNPKGRDKEMLNKLHLLVTEAADVIKDYRAAIQGADIFDLAVADPEVLDLIDNMPEFVYRARMANPGGYLVFDDSQVGAKYRAFSMRYPTAEFKVKELFALDETAVYGALALGPEDVEEWRQEMMAERAQAQDLFDALAKGNYNRARQIYAEIASDVAFYGKAERAAGLAIVAERTHRGVEFTQCIARGLGNIGAGLQLENLDFATWLVLGGRYVLNGKMDEKGFAQKRAEFERAIANMRKTKAVIPENALPFSKAEIDKAQGLLLKPEFTLPSADSVFAEKRTQVVTMGKVVGERTVVLAVRTIRMLKKRLALMLDERRGAMKKLLQKLGQPVQNAAGFNKAYDEARAAAGEPPSKIDQAQFSALAYWTQVACIKMLHNIIPDSDSGRRKERDAIEERITKHLSGGTIDPNMHRTLVGDLVHLMEVENKRLRAAKITPKIAKASDKANIEAIAKASELLDMCLLVSLEYDIDMAGEQNEEAKATEILFNFFDRTMNAHMFDYFPFVIQPSLSEWTFDEWYSYDEKFKFAANRHRWLYGRVRKIMTERTALRHKDEEYQRIWLGDVSDWQHPRNWAMGLGVNVKGEARRFWFNYTNLRDKIAMMQEFSGLDNASTLDGIPEVFCDVDPALLGADEKGEDETGKRFTNIVTIYPHGNTTIPVAIEQGVEMEKQGYNLMLCPFPVWTHDAAYGREVLQARDAVMYVSVGRYQKLLEASGVPSAQAQEMAARVPEQGIIVAIKFKEPLTASRGKGKAAYSGAVTNHASFSHFTHELRPRIDGLKKQPLIQPIVKEAADYLKGIVPEILKGTPVAFPLGFVWTMEDTREAEEKAKTALLKKLSREPVPFEVQEWVEQKISDKLMEFMRRYQVATDEMIEKPEKESGGRGAEALPILDRPSRKKGKTRFVGSKKDVEEDLKIKEEIEKPEGMKNLGKMAGIIYETSLRDNVVVQGVIPSFVRTLFTREFLEEIVADKAALGDVVSLDYEPRTPLFAYFRLVISRGSGSGFRTAMNIVVISPEVVGNVARRSILKVLNDDAIVPEFRTPLRRAMDNASSGSIEARHRYFRHAWPHILREYLVLNKHLGTQVNARLSKFLSRNRKKILDKFFNENSQFKRRRATFKEFFELWTKDFLGVDKEGRDLSAALAKDFGESMGAAFKQFLGGYLEEAGQLDLEIHYSMDDFMPLYLADDERNFRYILKKDKNGNIVLDDWGNVQILPLADFNGKATDVKLYADKECTIEIPTRDAEGNAIPVSVFVEKDGNLAEREVFDEHGNQVYCIEACVLEYNPGAGLWRVYDQELKRKGRGGEGVRVIFEDLGARGEQFKKTELLPNMNPLTEAELKSAREAAPAAQPAYLGAGDALYMKEPPAEPGSLENLIDTATGKVRSQDLNVGGDYRFSADDMSLVLTYMALERILSDCRDDWQKVRTMISENRNKGPIISWLFNEPALGDILQKRIGRNLADGVNLTALLGNAGYMQKIDSIIIECAQQEKDAMAIRIAAWPLDEREAAQLLGKRQNYGLVFDDQETLFGDTVHAFQIDGERQLGKGAKGFNFIGVHKDWLTADNKARMALVVDREGMVKKVEFSTPVSLHRAGIFHLKATTERSTHEELSKRFEAAGIPVLNPYSAALTLDSKSTTHQVCERAEGLEQPAYMLLSMAQADNAQTAKELLTNYVKRRLEEEGALSPTKGEPNKIEVVIKPDHGTEGMLSEPFIVRADVKTSGKVALVEDEQLSRALAHMKSISDSAHDDAVITERRGQGVTYKGKAVVFRVNACQTEAGFMASTGFARVAAKPDEVVVSKQTGATTEDINEVLWGLEWNKKPLRERVDLNYIIMRLEKAAAAAAERLNAKGIVGIDLLLEINTDKSGNPVVKVIFLEANPRPALLHVARRIQPIKQDKSGEDKKPESAPEITNPAFYQVLHGMTSGRAAASRQRPDKASRLKAALRDI